jgi:hypothetical protein
MGPSIGSFLTEGLTQEFKPDWADEIWAINMASNVFWHDVVIWMDDLDDQEKFRPGLMSCLRRRGKPVITTKRHKDIVPNSYDFPIEDVTKISMPIFGKPYFNNGVAMIVAYAMAKGVKTLKMYGCDFTYPDRNYAESGRGCTEAWMALASASGMTIILPDKSSLFDAVEPNKGVYGYIEQPMIDLGNDMVWNAADSSVERVVPKKEKPAILEEDGTYVAEDTRKDADAVSRHIPRTNGSAAHPAG